MRSLNIMEMNQSGRERKLSGQWWKFESRWESTAWVFKSTNLQVGGVEEAADVAGRDVISCWRFYISARGDWALCPKFVPTFNKKFLVRTKLLSKSIF